MSPAATTVDDYLATHPEAVRERFEQIRDRLRRTVPGYGEKISYQMPTVLSDGTPVLYVAAWKKHIGMYPVPFGDAGDEELIGPWRAAKDAVHLPYAVEVPWEVVDRIVALALAHRL